MTAETDRFTDLEIKLAWHDEAIEDLHQALVDKERRLTALEEHVGRLERALKILADRQRGAGEVAGALDVDDPVPRSG